MNSRAFLSLTILAGIAAFALPPAPATAQQHQVRMALPAGGTGRLPEGKTSITIPFKRSGEHILIPLGINGAAPIWVVLDTGMPSPGVMLYDGPNVEALKLEYSNMQAAVGGAGGSGGNVKARIALGGKLKIGDAEVTDAPITVVPRVAFLSAIHDGIVGMAVFSNFVTTVDQDRSEITLTDPKSYAPNPQAAVVPLELKGPAAYVEAQLVGKDDATSPVRLILDCGASHAVSLNASSSKSIVVPAGALRTRIGRGLSGEVRGQVGRIPGIELGGIRIADVVATFPDSEHENPRGLDSRNGNLGSGLLGRFNVTYDYPHQKMYLVKNQRFAESFEWDMSGLVLEPGSGDTITIAQVVPDSPAAAAGIVAGDRLVAIAGRPLVNRNVPDMRALLSRNGEQVEVQFVHDGTARTGKVTLRRMI
jgi:hypothetical protein